MQTNGLFPRLPWQPAPGSSAPSPNPSPPAVAAEPTLDALASKQVRFRISGSGPLSGRSLEPVGIGGAAAAARDGTAEAAVRKVLRLVEHAAGGPDRASGIRLNGISFSDSQDALAAVTYRAHIDDDPVFHAAIAGLDPGTRQHKAVVLANQTRRETAGLLANVVSGWVNVGPAASNALLGRGTAANEQQLADSVRILLHESIHAVDSAPTGMSSDADVGFKEALAEARSTSLPQLRAARSALELDGAVSDAALQASLQRIRPYQALEQALDATMGAAGVQPGSAEAARIELLPARQAVAELASRAAASDGADPQQAVRLIDEGFAAILRGTRNA